MVCDICMHMIAVHLLLVSRLGCAGRSPLLKRGALEESPHPMGIGPVGIPNLEGSKGGGGRVSHVASAIVKSMEFLFLY